MEQTMDSSFEDSNLESYKTINTITSRLNLVFGIG